MKWNESGPPARRVMTKEFIHEMAKKLTLLYGYAPDDPERWDTKFQQIESTLDKQPLDVLIYADRVILSDSLLGTGGVLDVFNDDTVLIVMSGATQKILRQAITVFRTFYTPNARDYIILGGTNDLNKLVSALTRNNDSLRDSKLDAAIIPMLEEMQVPPVNGARIIYTTMPRCGTRDEGFCGERFVREMLGIAEERYSHLLNRYHFVRDNNSHVMLVEMKLRVETFARTRSKFEHCPLDHAMPMLVALQRATRSIKQPQNFLRAENPILENVMYNDYIRYARNPTTGKYMFEINEINTTIDVNLRPNKNDRGRVFTIHKPTAWLGHDDPSKIVPLGSKTGTSLDLLRHMQIIGEILMRFPGVRIPDLPLPKRIRFGDPTWPLTIAICQSIENTVTHLQFVAEDVDRAVNKPVNKLYTTMRVHVQPGSRLPREPITKMYRYSTAWEEYTQRYKGSNPPENMTLYNWALLSRVVDERTLNEGPEAIRRAPLSKITARVLIALLSDAALDFVFDFNVKEARTHNRGIRQWFIAILIQLEHEDMKKFGSLSIVHVMMKTKLPPYAIKKILSTSIFEYFFGKYDPKPYAYLLQFYQLDADFLCAYKIAINAPTDGEYSDYGTLKPFNDMPLEPVGIQHNIDTGTNMLTVAMQNSKRLRLQPNFAEYTTQNQFLNYFIKKTDTMPKEVAIHCLEQNHPNLNRPYGPTPEMLCRRDAMPESNTMHDPAREESYVNEVSYTLGIDDRFDEGELLVRVNDAYPDFDPIVLQEIYEREMQQSLPPETEEDKPHHDERHDERLRLQGESNAEACTSLLESLRQAEEAISAPNPIRPQNLLMTIGNERDASGRDSAGTLRQDQEMRDTRGTSPATATGIESLNIHESLARTTTTIDGTPARSCAPIIPPTPSSTTEPTPVATPQARNGSQVGISSEYYDRIQQTTRDQTIHEDQPLQDTRVNEYDQSTASMTGLSVSASQTGIGSFPNVMIPRSQLEADDLVKPYDFRQLSPEKPHPATHENRSQNTGAETKPGKAPPKTLLSSADKLSDRLREEIEDDSLISEITANLHKPSPLGLREEDEESTDDDRPVLSHRYETRGNALARAPRALYSDAAQLGKTADVSPRVEHHEGRSPDIRDQQEMDVASRHSSPEPPRRTHAEVTASPARTDEDKPIPYSCAVEIPENDLQKIRAMFTRDHWKDVARISRRINHQAEYTEPIERIEPISTEFHPLAGAEKLYDPEQAAQLQADMTYVVTEPRMTEAVAEAMRNGRYFHPSDLTLEETLAQPYDLKFKAARSNWHMGCNGKKILCMHCGTPMITSTYTRFCTPRCNCSKTRKCGHFTVIMTHDIKDSRIREENLTTFMRKAMFLPFRTLQAVIMTKISPWTMMIARQSEFTGIYALIIDRHGVAPKRRLSVTEKQLDEILKNEAVAKSSAGIKADFKNTINRNYGAVTRTIIYSRY